MKGIATDLCIIGAGAAGLSLAAGAAQMGARVVLIEAGEMGGDCLNAGCVPSKALLAAAKAAQAQRRPAVAGIAAVEPRVDFAAVMGHVAATIAAIAPNDSQERFEGLGVTVIRDWARFVSEREVVAGDFKIRARRFAIATGSTPAVPELPGLMDVPFLTNETIFKLTERPDHLVVMGGGPIGMEMALAFRRLGAKVTVVEAFRALGREDEEAAALVLAAARAEGIDLREGQAVSRVETAEGGSGVALMLADGSRVEGSHLLVAVGRKPALARLDLGAAGVQTTSRGIKVDGRLRTTNRRIFAMGDVAGEGQFTHLAGYHAGIVLRQAVLGLPARTRSDHIPRVTFTDPELAQIGPTEAEARKLHGAALTVLRADFHHNDRALAEAKAEGFVKLIVLKGRVLGVTAVGQGAGELIGLWALALAQGLKLSAVAGMVAPYPTRGEASKRAAGAYYSPRLFDSPMVKRLVRLVQAFLP